ncbi:CHASE4 domain-containing protein [Leptolyngbya sp. FACHB-261]|uniref:sensor histidine kinase n=1 Tax=Leptolyngbya sp. FACHB-261 TaxID=2692806 RepID=UPI0016856AD4|nr:CHASE4 domain-containing protein [Leptolyngbya sp. FACHB-261]MBD2105076.1 PAS domain S-box protein [Leptolyngbya sp. FACHB-261]
MTLRQKTLLLLAITLTGLLGALSVTTSSALLDSFGAIEAQSIRRDVERAQDALAYELADLNKVATDWSIWDDTYSFIRTRSDRYIQLNLKNSTLANLKLNFMLFLDSRGQVVFSKAFGLEQREDFINQEFQQSLAAANIHLQNPEQQLSGIMLLPDGPALVAAQPILTSEGNGPSRGTLILGRNLDPQKIQQLAQLTHLSLNLRRIVDANLPFDFQTAQATLFEQTEIPVQVLAQDSVAGYALLRDIYGKPALLLRVESPRDIYQQGATSLRYFFLALLLTGFGLGSVALLLLDQLVLARLAQLNTGISRVRMSGDLNLRIRIPGRDELARLAHTINGMLEGLACAEQDLRDSEREYRCLVESLKEVIFQTDTTGLWRFLNPSWEAMTGFSVQESLGRPILNFIHPDDRQHHLEEFLALIKRRKESTCYEVRYVTKEGVQRWLEIQTYSRLDFANNLIGTSGTLNDITERKQVEAERLRAEVAELARCSLEQEITERKRIEHLLFAANQVKSQFLATMSHELRTPMNAVLGFAQLLLRNQLSPYQIDMVGRIFRNGKQLLSLIEEILDFSKLEAGSLELELQEFDLEQLVLATCEEMRVSAQQKSLYLQVYFKLDNAKIVNDYARLRQVLINLLANAIKFTEVGGVELEVCEPTPERVTLTVRDTGIGIASADLESIFDEFHRVNQVWTHLSDGTGLGLAIVKHLVQKMQGTVTVESELAQGSIFQVEIPRRVSVRSYLLA